MTIVGRTGRCVVALTLAAFLGCQDAPTAWMPPYLPYVEGDPTLRRLDWEARAISDYDYRLFRWAEFGSTVTVRVEVRGGVVVRVVFLENDVVLTGDDALFWPTQDELFDAAATAFATPDALQVLTYDAKLDYVSRFWVYDPDWEDDAWGFEVSNFVRR
jgi:hypothetical protein